MFSSTRLLLRQRPRFASPALRSSSSSTPRPLSTGVGRQAAFAVGVAGLSLGAAAYYTNKDTLDRQAEAGYFSWRRLASSSTGGLQPSLAKQRWDEVYADVSRWMQTVGQENRLAVILAQNWLEMSEAKRTAAGLIGVFGGVWLAWRLPRRLGLGKWLAHDALSGKSVTMLTSTFSHRTIPHLAFNSIALFSFTTAAFGTFNFSELMSTESLPRSTSRYEFLAFFVTTGLVASLASHAWFARRVAGRLLAQGVPSSQVRQMVLPSLGASGAVYAIVSLSALSFPSTSVSLIFLPFFPIPIGLATSALLLVDLVGLIRGWAYLDHAAHLAGALAGGAYWLFGHEAFEALRRLMWDGQKKEKEREVAERKKSGQGRWISL
ncbi:hypothetical protein NBRC10512_008243 [Rhodotorula toruloides]|uniref:RHTO0S16e01926g1_1 n=2 Tax=Rhodotorula toruloides TaxID=5286 RepID=A0A061BDW6_RHOTO|nr:serine-type endopeptidase [Rhodotorula toruloides NP11]EMS20987.1 serine-type endopeptidase [Rhodotorula toruloides NP11]KAJ8294933.1 Presenilins-associated rhomboid-like protein, mitochondrial [Rhodotorula toruloides]CDR48131.1 RHTO0S16e01926g1_1 [Rhodotorula toruloides]